jgi:hypothetical protein
MKEKNELKIKNLAEQHIICGKHITKTQFDMIKRSKYGKYLTEKNYKSKFEKIMEATLSGEDVNVDNTTEYDSSDFNFIERQYVNHIIQLLENKFDISPLNKNYKKYDTLNLEDVINYLKKVMLSFENKCAYTSSRIEEVIKDSKTAKGLILGLRTLLA